MSRSTLPEHVRRDIKSLRLIVRQLEHLSPAGRRWLRDFLTDGLAQPSITCPRCHATSYNPNDIAQGYCGRCHWWTSDPSLGRITPPTPAARTESPLGAPPC